MDSRLFYRFSGAAGVEEEKDELLGPAREGLVSWSSLGPRSPSNVSVVA